MAAPVLGPGGELLGIIGLSRYGAQGKAGSNLYVKCMRDMLLKAARLIAVNMASAGE